MRHKVYRLCLLSVVIIAIVGGIFYYINYVQNKTDITEGTLVRQEKDTEDTIIHHERSAEDATIHHEENAEDIKNFMGEGTQNE